MAAEADTDRGKKLYEDWHWGIESTGVKPVTDPDYGGPDALLIETGRLVEVHFRNPKKRTDTVIKLTRKEANGSHLVFNPDHPHDRLYIVSHPDFAKRMHKKFRRNADYDRGSQFQEMPLSEMAKIVGGKHGTPDYPKVEAVPIGILTHVVYATEKKGDGFSFYIHKMGEESGIKPALALDERGRLWIVGGNYESPTPGITD